MAGACEGVCACSTCHIIFDDTDTFDSLPESEEIEDVSGMTDVDCDILHG
jgi:ferredoxin